MTVRRLWVDAATFAAGFALGWLVADAWVRGRLEDGAPGDPWEFPA